MISCRTIIGTAVIEIEKGIGLGQIHQVLVDDGVLLTFVVKANQGGEDYALLPGSNIHGIGDFAAMVKNGSALQAIDENGLAALAEKQGSIFDEMVITVDGNKIGRVVDYHIDPKNEIGFLIVNPENEGDEIQIPKSQILMIGKEYIILNEAKSGAVETVQVPPVQVADVKPIQVAAVKEEETPEVFVAPVVETKVPEQVEVEAEEELDRDAIFAQFDAAALMAKKHKEVEAAKAETSEFDFSTRMESVPKPVTEPVASREEEAFATKQDTQAEQTSTQEDRGPLSLEEAFDLSPSSATEPEQTESRPAQQEPSQSEDGNHFLTEQKRLLVGKRLQKDLLDADGNAILLADEVVSDAMIDLLRRIDRRLLVRLAGCVI